MWKNTLKALFVCAMCTLLVFTVYTTPVTGEDSATITPSPTETTPTETPTMPTEPNVTESTEPESEPEPAPTEPPHVHQYQESVISATCTEQGYTAYTCECEMSYVDAYTEALGHQWEHWSTEKKATWFERGRETRTCARCAEQETRAIEKRIIPNSGTITIAESKNVLDYLIEPQPEDFGKYYENAVKLYNAFMAQEEDWCYIFFAEDTYQLERAEWRKLKAVFEEKCFQNCGVSIYVDSYSTGAFPEGAGLTRINIKVRDTLDLYTECCEAIQDMGLYNGMTQYEAVLTINEWMRENITYELQHWSPIDVLQTGKAQCAGYAYLFEYLCKYTGIEAMYVRGCSGHSDGPCDIGCHAWNKVQLAGTWYYIDVCWNDNKNPNRYFLTPELWAGRVSLSELKTA